MVTGMVSQECYKTRNNSGSYHYYVLLEMTAKVVLLTFLKVRISVKDHNSTLTTSHRSVRKLDHRLEESYLQFVPE
jgi:hypothetical protein